MSVLRIETTKNIYSLESLVEACSQGRSFKLIIFYGYDDSDLDENAPTSGCFSQFYPINFTDDNQITYSSLFQYISAQKAKLFNDEETFQKIMSTTNIDETYQLRSNIKNFKSSEWDRIKDRISFEGMKYKFCQNPKLKSYLLSFPLNTIFVSANPNDNYYGTCINLADDRIYNPSQWEGLNKHGFQLTELRDQFYDLQENESNPKIEIEPKIVIKPKPKPKPKLEPEIKSVKNIPIYQSYNIPEIPGIYAGEYPGTKEKESTLSKLNEFYEFGVRHFIDLTQNNEYITYNQYLGDVFTYKRFPIQNHGIPDSIESVHYLINEIKNYLEQQNGYVYIHCGSGRGRTSTILACLISVALGIKDTYEIMKILDRNFKKMPKSENESAIYQQCQKEFLQQFVNINEKPKDNPSDFPQDFPRDFPIYFMTDIHMNQGPLEGISSRLTNGIVALNGDVVLGVKFLHHKGVLGSKDYHSIVKTEKGKWSDPLNVINILKRREPQSPIVYGFGNHEVNYFAYDEKSIKMQDYFDALKKINVFPICTFPDYSYGSPIEHHRRGIDRCYKIGNTYFFSYITSNIVKVSKIKRTRQEHENEGIDVLAHKIQEYCNSNTMEIILLLHASPKEVSNVAKNVVRKLAIFQSRNQLCFNIFDVHFNVCCGHKHGSNIPEKYRSRNHYWEGKLLVDVFDKQKSIRLIFPNCADDCIALEPDNSKKLVYRFTTNK